MSKLTLPILISLLVFWLIGATWWFNSKYNYAAAFDSDHCSIPFILQDGSFQTKAEKSIFFEKSDWEPIIPMQTLNSFKSVALHLANNHNKTLTLIGWFGLDELNNSDFRNNGIARAEAVKNEIVNFGAPENNIVITSDSVSQIELSCGKIMGGVDFIFGEYSSAIAEKNNSSEKNNQLISLADENDDSENLQNADSKKNSIFNAKEVFIIFYNENTFKPDVTKEIDYYFKALAEFLDKNKKSKLHLMGHTDNVGNPKKHFNFGKYRARKLRDVIMTYGVAKNSIITDSRGSTEPLASNNSKEGRLKNRRVVITIIE